MTKKLFYEDPRREDFDARVIHSERVKTGWEVELDQTCFYPEGGGQPADKGWINEIAVEDVQKRGDRIYHYLPENPGEGPAKCRIDMEYRFDFMQQHSGQHIISAALWKIGGFTTVSVHMGSDVTMIEIDHPEINDKKLLEIETLANGVIEQNLPMTAIWTNETGLKNYTLRKPTAHRGDIRLIAIGDIDAVACGGIHVPKTGAVGLVKAVGVEKIRGHARIKWKIGRRAYRDYRKKDFIVNRLRVLLETNEDALEEKIKEIRKELGSLKKEFARYENEIAASTARQLFEEQASGVPGEIVKIHHIWRDGNNNVIKKITKNLLEKENVLFCFLNLVGHSIHWTVGCSENLEFPFEEMGEELLAVINGKGGGRSPLWQGTGTNPQTVEEFLSTFTKLTRDWPDK